jgi:hypothetical protein
MGRPRLLLALAVLAVAAGGCAGRQSLYRWGDYDQGLYDHYRKPADREAWVARLKAIMLEVEQEPTRIPPGLYAEYGYALFEEGNNPLAIAYFEKEKARWPESTFLMDKLIRNARGRLPRPPGTTGPATQVEEKIGPTPLEKTEGFNRATPPPPSPPPPSAAPPPPEKKP